MLSLFIECSNAFHLSWFSSGSFASTAFLNVWGGFEVDYDADKVDVGICLDTTDGYSLTGEETSILSFYLLLRSSISSIISI